MAVAFYPLDPVCILLDIARRRYPDIDIVVGIYSEPLSMEGAKYGVCSISNTRREAVIQLNAEQPYGEIAATLAHELAHAKIGIDFPKLQPHGTRFKAELLSLIREFNTVARGIADGNVDQPWADLLAFLKIPEPGPEEYGL